MARGGSPGADGTIPVAVLGATGAVGQRFVSLLEDHPWFRVGMVCASDRSAGKRYGEATRWFLDRPMPEAVRDLEVLPCRPGMAARLAFSGLDATVAGTIEEEFARAGHAVVSNSGNHRMDADVPLVIPEINASHLALIDGQRRRLSGGGFVVTNPNCSTVGLALAMAPLHQAFGVTRVVAATLQAVSGAGYPGVPAADILDNVIPYIAGEEEKIESETLKILGEAGRPAEIAISAHCHRVHVSDGHSVATSVATRERTTPQEAAAVLREFRGPLGGLGLPSLPERPLLVREEPDRPQPRFDRMTGGGMVVTIGRVRRCPVLDLRLQALVHNTIRGAAGAAILNAELLKAKGYL